MHLFNNGVQVMKSLMESLYKVTAENAQLTAENAELNAKNAQLTAENAKLTAEKQTSRDKTNQQAEKMRDLMEQKSVMLRELERLQAENENLQQTEKKATLSVFRDTCYFSKIEGLMKNGAPVWGLSERQQLFVGKNELGQWTVTRSDGTTVDAVRRSRSLNYLHVLK